MQRLRNLLLISTALMPIPALAGPVGGTVVGGSATINNPGTANVTIQQFSDKAIINWHMFNIGAGEKVKFEQPNSNSVALNKVVGGMGPSQIYGSLDANGKVFLINRDGFIFGAGAVINTAGFLATTSDIKNEEFMAGRFNFNIPGRPDASIVNAGTITAHSGGFAALVAPGVRNSGTITANLGTVVLGAGNIFNLDFYGDRLITLGVGDQIAAQVKDVATGQTLKSLITNTGKLSANGGRVELTAAAARVVVDSVINTSGVIEANSVGMKNGQIVLSAATGAPKSNGGGGRGGASTEVASLPPQKVKVSGKLSASGTETGTKGGSIIITGEHIEVAGATIDASGSAGGGKVLIGGDWGGGKPDMSAVSHPNASLENFSVPNATTVSVDAATKIDVSAKDRGDGGKVILWANDHLSFTGTILALGGAEFGRGGFVETSAHSVDVSGTVNAGKGGTWLLDPADLIINTGLAATIQASLNSGTDVTQQTATTGGGNGDIIFQSGVRIEWNTSATLTLIAFRNIQFNDGAFGPQPGNIVNTGSGNLVLKTDSTGTGFGTLVLTPFTNPTRINWTASTGHISLYYNPTVFGTQDVFTSGNGNIQVSSASQLTQYMLVNTETKLQNMGGNLAGNYALAKDISASSIPNFAPIGGAGTPFTGKFDGQGHTISNLTIAPTTPSTGSVSIGMFGSIGVAGQVSNLNITNASVTANPNVTGPGQFIGILAGTSAGTVDNVTVSGVVSNGTAQNGVIAGGLVGQNAFFGPGGGLGTINNSHAVGISVAVGDATSQSTGNSAGGLVGDNPGTITNSTAGGVVTGGKNSNVGGLVGRNENSATISGSTSNANVNVSDATGGTIGGLVGFNFGSITLSNATGNVTAGNSTNIFTAGAVGGFVGINDNLGNISLSFATGNVTGGDKSSTGGFVGFNNGSIIGSGAGGTVTGADNSTGGFAGFNAPSGNIISAFATGNVFGAGFETGGFVGTNMGNITGALATGNVVDTSTGKEADVGGFAGYNSGQILAGFASGNVFGKNNAGGFVGYNDDNGAIVASGAFGNVQVTSEATGGGFAGGNSGNISFSAATGNVSGGANTILGGFAAGHLFGTITDSSATGAVSGGANSIVGGFAGVSVSTGDLTRVTSSGAVSGTSDSYLGGLVGINFAKITDSTSNSTVTGSGSNNVAGGLVGVNFGNIDPSTSTGNVSSGANSIVGGFVGANAAVKYPDGFQLVGTISSDSRGTGTASGGSGSTVGDQVGKSYPLAGLPDLPTDPCSSQAPAPFCGGTLFNPNGVQQPDISDKKFTKLESLVNFVHTFVQEFKEDKKSEDVIKTSNTPGSSGGSGGAGSPGGQKGGGQQGGAGGARPPIGAVAGYGLGPLPSGLPPLNETRFLNNELVFQLGGAFSQEQLAALAAKFGLEITYREQVALLGRTVVRFRITGGRSVRDIIAAAEKELGANFSFQPSYKFEMAQDLAQGTAPADTTRKGDSAQYIVSKLSLAEAHLIATGKNVKVAVIDSEIDAKHPDIEGAIAGNFDALPDDDQSAHPHGTGMAGAIASHRRLLGVAPGAQILAIRAFGVNSAGAAGTSLAIVKGLQWAVDQGAKIINMSFAGPRDPILQQAIKRLTDQGIILIGAAGNAGPKSPPLFPGADSNVIAVSATDADDKTYKNANRGKYVAIAAPGVDILVPAPDGGYQLTTGTSVAAAHISGVVALLLERDGSLRPETVRKILSETAKNVGAPKTDLGAGLVDPVKALSKVGPKSAQLR